ncbi:hypothetical protein E2C01_093023 [Portunus trituberculatus]|uniref:Uncharacterized protein n=1 Tax=Portunus trituberculatus TaxID=210409 RepID=A0A5B7JX23_PORTR|nr:hypothetical protein [Portunus trituberculatus]
MLHAFLSSSPLGPVFSLPHPC